MFLVMTQIPAKRRSPTKAFFLYLVVGVLPIGAEPRWHFAVALLAILGYSYVIYRLLSDRGPLGDERGAEMSDSVYFLGFLQTMGVLGGAFLLARDAGTDRLLESVGLGVILTLAGLALRVGLSLSFGTTGGVSVAGAGQISASAPGGVASATEVLSVGQIADIQEYVSRLDGATREMATKIKRMAGASEGAMQALLRKQEVLREQIDQWQDAVNQLPEMFGSVTNSLQDSLATVGKSFVDSAEDFTAQVGKARENLQQALAGAHAQQLELNGIIARNLTATADATDSIQRLSARQLQDFSGVIDTIARLAEDVRVRTQAIPNPADILSAGLQQMATAAGDTSRALQATTAAAQESARSLAIVTSSADKIPLSLQAVGPGVAGAVDDLSKEVESSVRELRKQVKGIDDLLGEFAKLVAGRVKDIGK